MKKWSFAGGTREKGGRLLITHTRKKKEMGGRERIGEKIGGESNVPLHQHHRSSLVD